MVLIKKNGTFGTRSHVTDFVATVYKFGICKKRHGLTKSAFTVFVKSSMSRDLSEIILKCQFTAQKTFLIVINVESIYLKSFVTL